MDTGSPASTAEIFGGASSYSWTVSPGVLKSVVDEMILAFGEVGELE
jgi:hypothetical protein